MLSKADPLPHWSTTSDPLRAPQEGGGTLGPLCLCWVKEHLSSGLGFEGSRPRQELPLALVPSILLDFLRSLTCRWNLLGLFWSLYHKRKDIIIIICGYTIGPDSSELYHHLCLLY